MHALVGKYAFYGGRLGWGVVRCTAHKLSLLVSKQLVVRIYALWHLMAPTSQKHSDSPPWDHHHLQLYL